MMPFLNELNDFLIQNIILEFNLKDLPKTHISEKYFIFLGRIFYYE